MENFTCQLVQREIIMFFFFFYQYERIILPYIAEYDAHFFILRNYFVEGYAGLHEFQKRRTHFTISNAMKTVQKSN